MTNEGKGKEAQSYEGSKKDGYMELFSTGLSAYLYLVY